MKKNLYPLTGKHIAAIVLSILVLAIAYYQYQAYETERKLDLQRKEIIGKLLEAGRLSAEMMRNNPLKVPYDPLAPEDAQLGGKPSDAAEMAMIKLWHQSPPEQRKKLFATPDKLPTQAPPEQLLKAQVQDALNEQLSDDPKPSPMEQQALLEIQKQALAAKNKQN